MKRVLIIGPYWGAGWTESTRLALQALGCETEVIYYNRTSGRQTAVKARDRITSALRISRAATPNLVRQFFWLLNGWQLDSLIRQVTIDFKPTLVLILKGELILPFTLNALKRLPCAPKLVTWWVDNPLLYNETDRWLVFPRCVPIYDHLFIFDQAYHEPLKKIGAKQTHFLPCACDPAFYYPASIEVIRQSNLQSQICFIASFYPSRSELVNALLNSAEVSIWGPGWEAYRPLATRLPIMRGIGLPPSQVSIAYQAADIVLNSHHIQTKRGGLNTRSFEALACGSFQLVDYVHEMEDLLIPDEEIIVYHSAAEAAELASKFLGDSVARQKIVERGRKRVLAEHTYKHRMQTLLSTIA